MREARGYYRILVRHFDFEEGALQEGVARRGCVSYGQWRRFSLVGADRAPVAADAPLASLGAGGVALLVRDLDA